MHFNYPGPVNAQILLSLVKGAIETGHEGTLDAH